ncbi:MAG: DNA replication/repair protein RecF [Sphingobacteriia bacterium]|nr:DNA replication/repair protein RecF [Sphingobacteriia bacterium]
MENNKFYSITSILLENFRNYKNLLVQTDNKSVFIAGHNGAGKTSILEAISLLYPGKGMRGASGEEIMHNQKDLWSVYSKIKVNDEEYTIGTALTNQNNKTHKRIIKINSELVKSANELTKHISLLWLTPQMEPIFISGVQNRRKYLDRMVYNFDSDHARKITKYEKKLKERQILLKSQNYDNEWVKVIEQELVKLNIEIAIARFKTIEIIKQEISNFNSNFPRLKIEIKCEVTAEILRDREHAVENITKYLFNNRKIDFLSGRTKYGVHKSDLEIRHFETDLPLSNCSTGEQKAMLVSLTIYQALAKKSLNHPSPILLLDEILTHLDKERSHELLKVIGNLKMQAWVTSTDIDFWNEIDFPSKFLVIENSNIIKEV